MAQNINVTSLFYVNIDTNNKITKLIPNTTFKITQADIDTILNYYNKYGFLIMDFSINTNLNDINIVFMNLANNNVKRRYKLLTPITCLGKQKGLIDMRAEKSELYNKLKENKNSREFLEYFFQYNPLENTKTQRQSIRKMLRKTLKRKL
jgi:hypothetical protein